MRVQEIMTEHPACCTPETSLREVAQLMVDCDCGAIPIVESEDSKRAAGIVTDRDIVTRLVAKGQNPVDMRAADAMTRSTVTIRPDRDVDEAERLMGEHQVRRLIVVDDRDACIGIISQADLALRLSEQETGSVVEQISQPAGNGSYQYAR